MNIKRFNRTFEEINQYGNNGYGINRLAYSKTEQQALKHLIALFRQEGMKVKIDAAGNVIARREGLKPTLPAVACGSHIDTVYNGGRYDGTIGVVAGLEVIRSFNDMNIQTEHPIEIIVFACEESARFGVSTIGSKAMTGLCKKEELIHLTDKDGISLEKAFRECSLNIHEIDQAVRAKDDIKVFYELHVEQGPVLENEQKDIGVVTGIAAPTRFHIEIKGEADHSGTTPMELRKDAFLGAAEIALAVEEIAGSESSNGTVGTVGVCNVNPGAMNVVPGYAEIQVDIRSISISSKEFVVQQLLEKVAIIEQKRQLEIHITKLSDEKPMKVQDEIIQSLTESCEQLGYSYKRMASGAGHDAMNMGRVFPTGMIFIPSKNGLSHNPDEFTPFEKIVMGANVLKAEMMKVAHVANRGEQRASI